MTAQALTITYGLPSGRDVDPLDLLQLEQDKWGTWVGAITKQALVRMLAARLSGDSMEVESDCGMVGDTLVCTVRAWPRQSGLLYRLYTSWGQLSERAVDMVDLTELVQFKLTTESGTEHPVREILSVVWDDDCYGPEGEVVTPPTLVADGEQVRCGSPVYGTARVRYLSERHTYTLSVPRRDDAIDNHFSAVVVGVYAGGINWLEIEMPPGIESFEDDPDAVCGGRWDGGSIDNDDDDDEITPSGADRHTVVDYCTNTILSDTYPSA